MNINLNNLPDSITIGKIREMESHFKELSKISCFEKNNKIQKENDFAEELLEGMK